MEAYDPEMFSTSEIATTAESLLTGALQGNKGKKKKKKHRELGELFVLNPRY